VGSAPRLWLFLAALAACLDAAWGQGRVVRDGKSDGTSVMQGFAGDPNVAPYIDDIYAYLQARADGALGRGRPVRMGP